MGMHMWVSRVRPVDGDTEYDTWTVGFDDFESADEEARVASELHRGVEFVVFVRADGKPEIVGAYRDGRKVS